MPAKMLIAGFFFATILAAQPKRILYITHSAGFRHGSLPVSAEVMRGMAAASGKLEVIATEDVGQLNAANLRSFDAVFFFTSGELPISDQQKRDLLEFVRGGKGFGGAHSATDTFYNWPEYGDLIGAYFNGHPWVQQVRITTDDPSHPAAAPVVPAFTILDEIYQFRNFSREKSRVLLSLDPASVNLRADGVNPGTDDFPLAWVRPYGAGRVFYTALGHFDETWRDTRFQATLLGAMLWLTGQAEGESTPRPRGAPTIAGVANAASFTPRMTVSPGAIISIFGQGLTAGETEAAPLQNPPLRLAGTSLTLNGIPAPLFFASPAQVNAYVPLTVTQRICITTPCPAVVAELTSALTAQASLNFAPSTPGLFVITGTRSAVTLWTTGLGTVQKRGDLEYTVLQPTITIGGAPARVTFSGLAPGWTGLYQVNADVPPGATFPAPLEFDFDGTRISAVLNP